MGLYGIDLPSFDELQELASHDPGSLEELRKEITERFIDQANPAKQKKLRGLQFRINAVISGASNPIHSCILINQMMLDSTVLMIEGVKKLKQQEPLFLLLRPVKHAVHATPEKPAPTAEIIPFPGRSCDS